MANLAEKHETRADIRRRNRHPIIDANQFYSVAEFASFTDQSERYAREEIKRGGVKSIRSERGGRIEILGAWIIERNLRRAGVQS